MSGQGATAGVGGGALQITADALVRVEGSISAPGAGALGQLGGLACGPDGVGHGGGSGGALLLEARHVDIVGGAAANGGSGAAGGLQFHDGSAGCGSAGMAGLASGTVAATSGSSFYAKCQNHLVAFGGGGGSGSIGDGPGGDSSAPRSGSYTGCTTTDYTVYGLDGGGGGGAGRIRVNTFSDACGCTGFLSPTPTYGTVVVD
jgi:hypothetical protein